MNRSDLLLNFFYFLYIFLSVTSFGIFLITRFKLLKVSFLKNPIMHAGISTLIGLVSLGNISLIFGLLGYFNKPVILIILLGMFLVSVRSTVSIIARSAPEIRIISQKLFKNIIALIMIAIASAIMFTLYLSAMRPPYTIDEIAYHFPQAVEIVQSQKINLTSLGGAFYGNIPKLMEVIFATGIVIDGFSLAHAVNFMFLLGFLIFVFGFIYEYFGEAPAAGSVLLMTLYDDFTWNATTGYIDAATSILEVSAVLLTLRALTTKDKFSGLNLIIPGLLIGSALGMKYSPLPTTLFITVLILFYLFSKYRNRIKKIIPQLLYLIVPALIFGGYWYIKNLILFKNPFYPLYFGHTGMTEIEYESLINAIQQFKPKTISTYFSLINEYRTINGFGVYLSFYLFISAFFVNKNKKVIGMLVFYSLFYTLYWFLFATHQIRFLTTAILINSILMAIFVFGRSKNVFNKLNLLILAIVAIFLSTQKIPIKTIAYNYSYTKLHVEERQYALGHETSEQFYTRRFGCKYMMIDYLTKNNLQGRVIDNWTPWLGGQWPMIAESTRFTSFITDKRGNELKHEIETNNFKYIFIQDSVKKAHMEYKDLVITMSRDKKLPTEEYLLKSSKKIYSYQDCNLYQIGI